ncbi:MAG: DUF4147 domain-containing protein [Rhodobacteraceae bacterium]|nr:DUF4147 domain-containing protein [Paracoccaceae bacterium]
MTDDAALLSTLWHAGVNAVKGDAAVKAALPLPTPPTHIIAVGKAAAAMAAPAAAAYPDAPCLIVTKYDHAEGAPADATVIEAAHPTPDAASLQAGQALLEAVAACGTQAHLLMLVSGGASALAEALPEGWDLAQLKAETQRLLASGADIHAMNTRRKEISRIKGGKLLAGFGGAQVTTLAISDVEGDALGVIGSGIGEMGEGSNAAFTAQIVASNAIARGAVAAAADLPIHTNEEALYANVTELAPAIAQKLRDMPPGLFVIGGEPTVLLPDAPGLGGRNMALGLMLARELAGVEGLSVLVAGTDGTDGPTDAAGALITGATWDPSGEDALNRADAYPWLKAHGALFTTGPTGTNVMDLLLAIKR